MRRILRGSQGEVKAALIVGVRVPPHTFTPVVCCHNDGLIYIRTDVCTSDEITKCTKSQDTAINAPRQIETFDYLDNGKVQANGNAANIYIAFTFVFAMHLIL